MTGRRRRTDDPSLCGVLLLDKPAGPTSHDVVAWVRWVLGVRRVGHCGTLDPSATGLLVVGVGAATKLAPILTGQDKGYRARFVLGAATTTADAEGEVRSSMPCPSDTEARVPPVLAWLRGEHRLPPPAYSAIHVDGRRAHELARTGVEVELPPRPMVVHEVVPGRLARVGDRVEVEAELLVSKGTYVRSLAEAVGERLGLPAHLGALHRTRSGALGLDHPLAVTDVTAQRRGDGSPGRWQLALQGPAGASREAMADHLRGHLLAPAMAVPLPVLRVADDDSGRRALACLASGQSLSLADPGLGLGLGSGLGSCDATGACLAVASMNGPGLVLVRHDPAEGRLQPERVIVAPAPRP
ncbi:tRNA pseudouridine(55) synthase TruB [Paraliomyxa miuraensis]|uniref:tRNA pseudouridine(55) synthase TruB n=1 Tax=Paraliomyxa miuraensis TaxID=376150 RepID=UPI00225AA9FE|nr:tRNA pseudouridine(55) synthase TruB [Paraliomyxa miuraensis]MCX4244627.1 tRNA pseudouridine(55) synthase TruB [Paraliomyxa miuraensis]